MKKKQAIVDRAFCKTLADRFFGLLPKIFLGHKFPTINSMRIYD